MATDGQGAVHADDEADGYMFDLNRFIEAQEDVYDLALQELRQGRKQTHWIWFVLPQLQVLGRSSIARTYGIAGLAEAKAYLAHPILGPRLIECTQAILMHRELSAQAMLGPVDALKFRSCLTLFARAAPSMAVFAQALEQFFAGQEDPITQQFLKDE